MQIDAHPGAPQLFATLMRRTEIAPELLPLLAEPARNALQVGIGCGMFPRSFRLGMWY